MLQPIKRIIQIPATAIDIVGFILCNSSFQVSKMDILIILEEIIGLVFKMNPPGHD